MRISEQTDKGLHGTEISNLAKSKYGIISCSRIRIIRIQGIANKGLHGTNITKFA